MSPLTLRDLSAIGVDRLKGVGEKKLASLKEVGVETVLDLLTTYPRRWVDRTNECRVSDLVPAQEALVLVTVRSVTKRQARNRRSIVEIAITVIPLAALWALAWLTQQAAPNAAAGATTNTAQLADAASAVNLNMGTLVGSYASVARMLDEVAAVPGTGGVRSTTRRMRPWALTSTF